MHVPGTTERQSQWSTQQFCPNNTLALDCIWPIKLVMAATGYFPTTKELT